MARGGWAEAEARMIEAEAGRGRVRRFEERRGRERRGGIIGELMGSPIRPRRPQVPYRSIALCAVYVVVSASGPDRPQSGMHLRRVLLLACSTL